MGRTSHHECDPLNWHVCRPGWAVAIVLANFASACACTWLLLSFKRLHEKTQSRIFPRLIWWLAIADFLYHTSWVVTICIEASLPPEQAYQLFQNELAAGTLAFFQQPTIAVSLQLETQIALYCLAISFRIQWLHTLLHWILPTALIIGIPLGMASFFHVIPLQVTGGMMLIAGVLNTAAYIVILYRLRVGDSPGSVRRRYLKRLAIYPVNFAITFGFNAASNEHWGAFDVFVLALVTSGLNGFLNVGAYAMQSRHAATLLGNEHDTYTRRQSSTSFDVGILADCEVHNVDPDSGCARSQAAAEASMIESERPPSHENAIVIREGGDILTERGELCLALAEYRQCAEILQTLLETHSSEYAITSYKIGDVLMLLGSFREALPEYEQASKIYKKLSGELSIEFATNLVSVGVALDSANRLEESLLVLKRAIEILRPMSVQSSRGVSCILDYATTLRTAGDVLVRLGRSGQASHVRAAWTYFEECTEIFTESCGVQSVNYAALLHSKGKAHLSQGELHDALATFEQAKEILESLEEQNDRYPLSLLALTIRCLGDTIAAEPGADMEECLACYRKCRELQLHSIGVEAIEFSTTERKIRSMIDRSLRGSETSKSPSASRKSKILADSVIFEGV